MSDPSTGAFDSDFARRKRWKLDAGLWRAIQATLPPPPVRVLDLGAGAAGRYVHALRDAGYHAQGLDGTDDVERISDGAVQRWDLTEPMAVLPQPAWALSFEVGEHLPAAGAAVYLDNLARAASDGLIVSWATPGQRGRNHVNCQPPEWVARELSIRGWHLNQPATDHARSVAGGGWIRKLLVFTDNP